MHQSKLLELLRTFSPRQLGRLRDFLESPYFNRARDIVQFLEFLLLYAPDFKHAGLSKPNILQHFKTDKPLTEKRLAYLMNQLLGLAEEFIAIESFRSDPLKECFTLIDAFSTAGLSRHLKTALDNAVSGLEQIPHRNAEFYAETYRLLALQYWHSNQMQHQYNTNLQQASDALDTFYLVEKLRYCLTMADTENILNLKYDWGLGQWLLDGNLLNQTTPNPTQQIYLTGIQMAQHPEDTSYFYQQKELLFKHDSLFNENEQKVLYTSLLNYCSRRINHYNDQLFFNEYFEINKTLLERGLLFEEGMLSPLRYLNLVNTGLRTGQLEWTIQFIREYRTRLPDAYAQDMYLMVMGQYHFHLEEYAQAQVMLNQVNPPNALLAVLVRNLLTRIYYVTGETELLLSFLEAYRVYLLRQDMLNPTTKKQARQFVDFTRRLAKIDQPDAHLLPKLLADLPPSTEIYHRDWLVAQIGKRMNDFKTARRPA